MNRNANIDKITSAIATEIEAFGEVMDVSKFRDLQKQLEKILITDAVTGVLNRWKMQELMDREVRAAIKNRHSLYLMVVDVDTFKRVNDVHGHIAGDNVLKAVAYELEWAFERTIGKSHRLGRWGGDEFVYVLPNRSLTPIKKISKQARNAINKVAYPVSNGVSLPISVSMGVGSVRDGDTSLSLLDRADKAMYRAKKNGGNCLEIY